MKQKVIFLGLSEGKSQKGNDFYVAHLGIPFNDHITGVGYMAEAVYLDSADEYAAMRKLTPATSVEMNVLYCGKGSYKVIL